MSFDTERLLVTGGPRTGKTTIAAEFGGVRAVPVRGTDSLIGAYDWSAASAVVAEWFDAPGPWIIEGVAVPRALRKWLAKHPTGKPADKVVWLEFPKVDRTPRQDSMARAVETVWLQVQPHLVRRGVYIERF